MLCKVVNLANLLQKVDSLRCSKKRIVFTNGCFDIMHVGHVRYLAAAKAEGDILIVGLNSDRSVKLIKGDKRPIVPEDQRTEILSGMWFVDYIIIFNEPDPLKLIKAIKPDVLVKGEDWPEDNIIGADFVKANGGGVVRIPMVDGISTSSIIEHIKQCC